MNFYSFTDINCITEEQFWNKKRHLNTCQRKNVFLLNLWINILSVHKTIIFAAIKYISIFSKSIFQGTTGKMETHIEEEVFSHKICGSAFSDSSSAKKHMHTHSGKKRFSCEVCGSTFSNRSNMRRHMRTHTGEKPFSCEICGSAFSRNSYLRRHIRTHTGERPFSCEVCGSAFSDTFILKNHVRTHTGEKPFSCQVCGSAFSNLSSLKTHMRTHTGEKPFFLWSLWIGIYYEFPFEKPHANTHWRETIFLWSVQNCIFTEVKL